MFDFAENLGYPMKAIIYRRKQFINKYHAMVIKHVKKNMRLLHI